MIRVLVLGGTRFLGRALVGELLGAGHTVAVVHRGVHEVDLGPAVAHIHCDRSELVVHRNELTAFAPDLAIDLAAMTAADAEAVDAAPRAATSTAPSARSTKAPSPTPCRSPRTPRCGADRLPTGWRWRDGHTRRVPTRSSTSSGSTAGAERRSAGCRSSMASTTTGAARSSSSRGSGRARSGSRPVPERC